jgi:hypothetical protein
MCVNKLLFSFVFLFALLLIPNISSSYAIPASGNPDGNPNPPQQESNNGENGGGQVQGVNNFWGIFGNLEYDPDAGPWVKQLNDFLAPCSCAVQEFITIGGGISWTDWHESFVYPPGGPFVPGDFVWTTFQMSASFDGGINFIAVPGLVVEIDGNDVWAEFDALPAGTVIQIQKEFEYLGINPPTTPFPIFIEEWPTIDESPVVVAGEIIPIEQTSLILAGAQTFSWMIPVLLSGIGIGLFIFTKRS